MLAPIHPDQSERLRALYGYAILDTPREADFEEIVELASQICEAPISLISFVDAERQWFKAEVGLGVRETGLDQSVCSHAILEDGFLEISDTDRDPRTADNPLAATEPYMRFYAGARLEAPNGMPLGTLCVLDSKPRKLTELQKKALKVLSRQVMKQLELRVALRSQDTLRHEADHRVKNSLQTLSSLVRLYGRNLTEPAAVEAFEAVRRRIEAIGALHGELQDSGHDDQIDVKAYLCRVVSLLQDSAPPHIAVTCESDSIELSQTVVSALGVIVSEFVANSIKHGYPDGRTGQVRVGLRREGATLTLYCQDDGVGSRDQSDGDTGQGNLGTDLVAAAASQLDGRLETTLTPEGSRLTLAF